MFVSALFVQAVLVATAFALPSSNERRGSRLARRASGLRLSHPKITNNTYIEYSSNWAGAGTYQSVTATFTVPTPQESSGSSDTESAGAWVGIDGDTCGSAILQTGVDFTVSGSSVSYYGWYEWYPDSASDFSGISFSSGDTVTLTVTATSTTSGTAVITNNSNGQTVSTDITSASALCEQDAEWIVEDPGQGSDGSLAPFPNFGTVTFTGASAGTSTGSVDASGAITFDIEQNGEVLTSTSISGSSITITYV
ncbi:uncharacterized protein PHACADRAFT_207576 [Phanerochaete carnosa HHB-10118-sp]|uniref:Uncharacterized protein n=1 Tax=Phanerochaete carnosa (strain HHB-10118-sp) TaxID=650164 RepID=K5V1E6_PHACS|nr:uncharacterized protein PHACADRAFT_207576 [Phanerochaete carnosa HHB-10118-sp]EKM56296.1 hypothetical protein PHACADRAFT_207576 [Phanerochaete carnosa HHB-10118-sp]